MIQITISALILILTALLIRRVYWHSYWVRRAQESVKVNFKPIGRTLSPGYGWNPLTQFRNIPCPCGSQRRAKVCHGMSRTLPLQDVEGLKQWLKNAGVIK